MAAESFYRGCKIPMIGLLLCSLMACNAAATPLPEPTVTAAPTVTATPVVCQPSEIQTADNGYSEIQATMHSDGEVWALLFFGTPYVGGELKIVWRITGTGQDFTVEARHEDGAALKPFWGPQYHEGSTWERPGEEWGTSFIFPEPGCWTVTATRGATIGEIRLDVVK